MKFIWDLQKDKTNKQKHKVSFNQASYIFADKYALTIYDSKHSEDEERWITLGAANNNVILVVVHTYREQDGIEYIRIISARKATKNEKKQYMERRGV